MVWAQFLRPGTWKFGFLVENYVYSLIPRSKLDNPGQNISIYIFLIYIYPGHIRSTPHFEITLCNQCIRLVYQNLLIDIKHALVPQAESSGQRLWEKSWQEALIQQPHATQSEFSGPRRPKSHPDQVFEEKRTLNSLDLFYFNLLFLLISLF